MMLSQLEKAEIWVSREMRSLQPRVVVVLSVFSPGQNERSVKLCLAASREARGGD